MSPINSNRHDLLTANIHNIVYPRILTVGDPQRAQRIAEAWFEKIEFQRTSHRGFVTINGQFQGVGLSIVSIGMASISYSLVFLGDNDIIGFPVLISVLKP